MASMGTFKNPSKLLTYVKSSRKFFSSSETNFPYSLLPKAKIFYLGSKIRFYRVSVDRQLRILKVRNRSSPAPSRIVLFMPHRYPDILPPVCYPESPRTRCLLSLCHRGLKWIPSVLPPKEHPNFRL